MQELSGKVAVVTGGGSGIGRGLCHAFAREGMDVVVADIEEAAAEAVAKEVRAAGSKAIAVSTDVADRASVGSLAERACDELGGVHVLCNNAGVVKFANAADLSADDWAWVMSVNLDGVLNGVIQFLPRFIAQGSPAHIVNTSSTMGMYVAPQLASYTASKYAVMGLSEHLRADLAPLGIGVSVLCPSSVRTQIVHAGRNRPDALGGREEPSQAVVQGSVNPANNGIDPLEVAAMVVAGIKANQPYIVTHRDTKPLVQRRLEALRAGFAPAPQTD